MPSYDRETYKDIPAKTKGEVKFRARCRCEVCGAVGDGFACHHLIPRVILEQLCPEQQNDSSILIYVCKECHHKLDMYNKKLIKLYKHIQEQDAIKDQITIFDIINEEEN